jgi:PAS domain-containing protein
MKTFAHNISQLLQLRNEKQFISQEKELFSKALSLNSSYYLLLDPDMNLREIGDNFSKSIPTIEKGRSFYDFFSWHSKINIDAFLESDKEDYGRLVLLESNIETQRYKCSISKIDHYLIICASPVINANFKIDNYHLKTKDFAFHDSILEFLFLQETTSRNIAEAKEINQKITSKSAELEKLIQQLQLKERELILSNIRIEEQRQFYSEILNNFPTDIAVFSTDHRYLFVNSRGIKDKETRDFMIGRTDYDYCDIRKIDYSIADKRRDQFNKVLATGQVVEWEDAYSMPDGSMKYILRRFAPVINASGDLMNVIGYGIEITDIKNYQFKIEAQNESIKSINDNLEKIVLEKTEKNNELTQMLAHQDKLAMVGEITAGITHDLNTPLGAIKVGSESLIYTLEHLFNFGLAPCSIDQLHWCCERSRYKKYDLFIGGMQTKNEIFLKKTFFKSIRKSVSAVSSFQNSKIGMSIKIHSIDRFSVSKCCSFDISVSIVVSAANNDWNFSCFYDRSNGMNDFFIDLID